MRGIGIFFAGLLTIGAVVGIGWALTENQLLMYKFFGVQFENTRRNIFEQSKAYNQGMIQELQNMQFEYEQADDSHKKVLASLILHRAADYDVDKLPPDLRTFIEGLKDFQ